MMQLVLATVLGGTPEAFVLLKPGTVLLPAAGIATDAGAHHFACCSQVNSTIAARFVADDGEFVEIETLGKPAEAALHCASTYLDDPMFDGQLSSYQIKVRVRRRDVLTVLQRPLKTPSAEVAAGVPVEVLDGGLLAFGLYGTTREFTLPQGAATTGSTYTPGRWVPARPTPTRRELRLLTGVLAPVGDGGTVTLLPGEYWPTTTARAAGTDVLLRVEATCARVTARVPATALFELDAGSHRSVKSADACAGGYPHRAKKGSTIFWPDGRRAGQLRADEGIDDETVWVGDGGLVCSNVTLQQVEGSLPLCFRPADVYEVPD